MFLAVMLIGPSALGQATKPRAGQAAHSAADPPVKGGAFTRQTFHDKDHKLIKEVYQVKDTVHNVPHGRYVSYFLNGKMESRGQFANNETTGVWEFYYETGNLKMRGILLKGANYGIWEYFFEGGNKSMEGIINGRAREGEWKTYYENGQLKEVGSYRNNQREGYWKYFFEDGARKGEIDYTNDQGRYIEYYHSGKVRAEGPKSGNRSTGLWRYFSEDGTLQSEGEYRDGKKEGTWISYYASGKVASKGLMVNDEPTGNWEYWHENGKPSGTGSYINGGKTNKWVAYSESGKVISETWYVNGRGEYSEYFASGKLKVKGSLLNDKREGTWEFFDETGRSEGVCDYQEGKGIYNGYYPNGALQTKGAMDGDLKAGTWEIYETDGKLSGYYRPFYDDKKLSAEITALAQTSPVRAVENTSTRVPTVKKKTGAKRHSGYFTPRYNEVQGVIFGTNPVWLAAGELPLAIEFYLQERLGHEFEFIGIRDPFFVADERVAPGRKFERGYSIAIKQKFYNLLPLGMWYFGHEIRFTNVGHFVNEALSGGSGKNIFTFNANEQRVEWGAVVGYRLMQRKNVGGLTVDAFVSGDIGYRNFHVDAMNTSRFEETPRNSFGYSCHFGLNLGHVFAFR